MDNTVVCEIAGKKYVIVDIPEIEGQSERFKNFIKRNGMIYKGIKSIDRGGLLSRGVIVQTYFLPEENFISYSNDKL